MAPEAGLHRGNAGLTRDRDRRMTVEARNPVLPGVDVVPEEDRLAGTIQVSRVADDGSVLGGRGLTGLRRSGKSDCQSDADPGRDPTTPLRHQ